MGHSIQAQISGRIHTENITTYRDGGGARDYIPKTVETLFASRRGDVGLSIKQTAQQRFETQTRALIASAVQSLSEFSLNMGVDERKKVCNQCWNLQLGVMFILTLYRPNPRSERGGGGVARAGALRV